MSSATTTRSVLPRNRGERRNALARATFHGQRGQLRKHYQVGQENQLGAQPPAAGARKTTAT